MGRPDYLQTNESLHAIVAGLEPCSDDVILAICGSGDQPFALLENGSKVLAVDDDESQIELAVRRAEKLESGDFNGFFPEEKDGFFNDKQREYFTRERLARIRANLCNLRFQKTNIHSRTIYDVNDVFSKLYLSNIPMGDAQSFAEDCRGFSNLAERVSQNGLIYHAEGGEFVDADGFYAVYCPDEFKMRGTLWPTCLQVDERLTHIARVFQNELHSLGKSIYKPVVFRKI